MKNFAQLLSELELKAATAEKAALLTRYFRAISPDEKSAAITVLSGRAPKRVLANRQLTEWALELSGIPPWLFEESYRMTGDLAETIALLLPPDNASESKPLARWLEEIRGLSLLEEKDRKTWVMNSWMNPGQQERFILNKLLAGALRPAIPLNVLVSALSGLSGLDPAILTRRLSQTGEAVSYAALTKAKTLSDEHSLPYPNRACTELEEDCCSSSLHEKLGPASLWTAEWKWEGLPVQIISRKGELHLWTARKELVTREFPELHAFMGHLPDGTVLEGELLTFREGQPIPSPGLQKRIGRKSLSKKLLQNTPAAFLAYDCLEYNGKDIRDSSARERRQLLETLFRKLPSDEHFRLSSLIPFDSWEELAGTRENARRQLAEGLLLKKRENNSTTNRKERWKWKAEPFKVPGVLLYARKDSGTGLYTNFSFAVWEKEQLVSFASADAVFNEKDAAEITAFITENSVEKFGPVRTVKPRLVFEIAFDSISPSPRRKTGLAVSSARVSRWLKDLEPEEAATLEALTALCWL